MENEINLASPTVVAVARFQNAFQHTPTNSDFRDEVSALLGKNKDIVKEVVNTLINNYERYPTMAQIKKVIAEQRARVSARTGPTGHVCPDCNGSGWVRHIFADLFGKPVEGPERPGVYPVVKGCARCGGDLFNCGSGRVPESNVTRAEREAMRPATPAEAKAWAARIREMSTRAFVTTYTEPPF
jgi:hypothetical protein